MESHYEGPYKERLIEIESRIKDLKAHRSMWSRAGGGRMAMQAVDEIQTLEAERDRILNGSQAKIDEIQNKIRELQELKAQCKFINFIKKHNLNKQINNYENEKANVIKR